MHPALRSKDVWAGTTFLAFALAGAWFGRGIEVGSPARMGPGFFPIGLSMILGAIGLVVMIRGLAAAVDEVEPIRARPFLIMVAFVLFALLLPTVGLIAAIPAMTVVGSLARPKARPLETLMLAVVLTAFSWFVFIFALSLPIKLLVI